MSDKKISKATHNISAYRFVDKNGHLVQVSFLNLTLLNQGFIYSCIESY